MNIKKHLKNIVKQTLLDKIAAPIIARPEFAQTLLDRPRFHLISGGNDNPGIFFYVIQRTPGAGFFSNFAYVLNHLKIAFNLGMTPVIDFQNFPTLYNEQLELDGTRNAWEYYFEQPSSFTLEEVYCSKSIAVTDGGWYPCMPMSITRDAELFQIAEKFIRPKPIITSICDAFWDQHLAGEAVLAVHFRGLEQTRAAGHPLPPTKKQIVNKIDSLLESHHYAKMFVVTESVDYLNFLRDRYGQMIYCLDSFRSQDNSYLKYPRDRHRYLLGRDILVETILLSRADALICGGSNVSETATFFAHGKDGYLHRINNGSNSMNPMVAKYLWRLRSALPKGLGGFN